MHPETGKPITAGLGRYGPFILHDGTYANLDGIEDVFSVGINRAVTLLAEKKAGGGKSRFQRAKPTVLKDLGEHPGRGGKIEVLSGRYGPYVKHGEVNATLPNGKDPAAITRRRGGRAHRRARRQGPGKAEAGAESDRRRRRSRRRKKAAANRQGREGDAGQSRRAKPARREDAGRCGGP